MGFGRFEEEKERRKKGREGEEEEEEEEEVGPTEKSKDAVIRAYHMKF